MNDESMRDERKDEPRAALSRRGFLQRAGVAVVGVAGLAAVGTNNLKVVGQDSKDAPPETIDSKNCGSCLTEAAIQLYSVAAIGGQYFGLVETDAGHGLFPLKIDGSRGVSVGAQITTGLPEDFVFASIGVFRDQLTIGGSLPFLLDSFEVQDGMTDSGGPEIFPFPETLPTSGTRRFDVMGLEPAAFMTDLSRLTRLELPEMPKRSAAGVLSVSETVSGSLAVMIGHNDGLHENYYEDAVDVLEWQNDQWTVWNVGRNLGESGPNYLAADGGDIVVGINTSDGPRLVWVKSGLTSENENIAVTGEILGLVSGGSGLEVLSKDDGSVKLASPIGADGARTGKSVQMNDDEIVGVVAVAGAPGQVVLLGRQSVTLIEITNALVGKTNRRK